MANYVISIMVDAKDKNVKQVLGGVGRELNGLSDTAERTGDRMGQAFTGAGIAMAFGQAIPLIKSAVGAYNELRAGMVGLRSIVKYSGEDWGQAQAAMDEYIKDGLVPMSQATTALKNLLLRGYGLEKSIELLGRFKDAAAYGRQGALSMGQAITSASEGLKNENSILVDNAGVTKNVSVMWKEYAASIGTTVGKLTQAEKLQAEYNGILAETAPMLGNAAELTGELSGKMAQAEAKVLELKQAIGEAFAPTVAAALDKVVPLIDAIKQFAQANPMATVTLLGGSGLVAAVGALAAAFALMGVGGAIVVAVVAGLVGLATVIASLVDKHNTAVQRSKEHGLAMQAEAESVRELAGRYEELKAKTAPTREEQVGLKEVTEELIELVPELSGLNITQAESYYDLAKAAREYAVALDDAVMQEYKSLNARHAVATADAAATKTKITNLEDTLDQVVELSNGETARWRDLYGPEATLAEEQLKRYNLLYEDQIENVRTLGAAIAALGIEPVQGPEWEEPEIDTSGTDAAKESVDRLKTSYSELRDETAWLMHGQEIQIWNETGEAIGDATEWLEAFYATKKAEEEASLASFESSFQGHLNRLGKDMSNWKADMTSMIGSIGDQFAATWAAAASGNEDAIDSMKEYWKGFFDWLVGEITRIIIKWFIGQVLTSMGIPGGGTVADLGMDIIGESSGGFSGDARAVVRSGLKGLQEATLMDGGALMRGAARGSYTRRDAVPVYADQGGAGAPVVVEEHTHFHSADYPSFRRAIRGGQLGREIAIAQRHGRMGR